MCAHKHTCACTYVCMCAWSPGRVGPRHTAGTKDDRTVQVRKELAAPLAPSPCPRSLHWLLGT